MTEPLSPSTRRYIEKRIAAGVWASQIKSELLASGVRVPFADILALDPERKGEADRFIHQRDENRELLKRVALANAWPNWSTKERENLPTFSRKRHG